MKMTTDTLLTPTELGSAKIHRTGWKMPALGTADTTEKATGTKLGEIGIASPEDVSKAGAARQVQEGRSPIRRLLIPIDALEVKPVDLKPVLQVAERFDAEVTLLHCYEIPPSFDYAIGPSALMEVTLHRDMAKKRLLKLCTEVRKFFTKCRCKFAVGSLPVEILRASDTLHADLIVVPMSLDLVSHAWTTKELLDELVRKANCSVLEIPRTKVSSR